MREIQARRNKKAIDNFVEKRYSSFRYAFCLKGHARHGLNQAEISLSCGNRLSKQDRNKAAATEEMHGGPEREQTFCPEAGRQDRESRQHIRYGLDRMEGIVPVRDENKKKQQCPKNRQLLRYKEVS